MNTTAIPQTQNHDWGFYGNLGEQAEAAWPVAMAAITVATGEDSEAVRAFLDGKSGRHFGDDVHNAMHRGNALPDAIEAAVARWMGWTIGPVTSKDYGIPKGLPYLTGFVIHEAIGAE